MDKKTTAKKENDFSLEKYKDYSVIGLNEPIRIYDSKNRKIRLMAKIDTGATISSIDIKIAGKLKLGPIVKTAVIKAANGKERRGIIETKIKIKNQIIKTHFTLADRTDLRYKAIIGKDTIKKGKFIIDINKKYKTIETEKKQNKQNSSIL